ncbi:MAG: hypothetical protein IKS28_05900, partial [Clostridia bacterium]|nr:hypothetical protein [Clostridia bacterium]
AHTFSASTNFRFCTSRFEKGRGTDFMPAQVVGRSGEAYKSFWPLFPKSGEKVRKPVVSEGGKTISIAEVLSPLGLPNILGSAKHTKVFGRFSKYELYILYIPV